MRRHVKRRLLEMADTLSEAAGYMLSAPADEAAIVRQDFLAMLRAMDEAVQDECAEVAGLSARVAEYASSGQSDANVLFGLLRDYEAGIRANEAKAKVVFLPNYANTWDSLKSVYEAFAADPSFETEIVIVPINRNTATGSKLVYADYLTPAGIPNTHYSRYSFEADNPDVVFYNNPYDAINLPQFTSHEIKKYAGLMVYIPYYLYLYYESIDLVRRGGQVDDLIREAVKKERSEKYGLSGHANADVIILQSELMVKQAVGTRNRGKMVALGNPKTDYLYQAKVGDDWPRHAEWEKVITGKKVFMLNTHYTLAFIKEDDWVSPLFLKAVFSYMETHPEAALIWRPHPQTFMMLDERAAQTKPMREYLARAGRMENVIIDRTDSAVSAMMYSSALLSSMSSIVNEYLVLDKPVFVPMFKRDGYPKTVDDWRSEECQRQCLERHAKSKGDYLPDAVEGLRLNSVCTETLSDQMTEQEILDALRKHIAGDTVTRFMNAVLNGEDPMAAARKRYSRKCFMNLDGSCAERILKYTKRRL